MSKLSYSQLRREVASGKSELDPKSKNFNKKLFLERLGVSLNAGVLPQNPDHFREYSVPANGLVTIVLNINLFNAQNKGVWGEAVGFCFDNDGQSRTAIATAAFDSHIHANTATLYVIKDGTFQWSDTIGGDTPDVDVTATYTPFP